jgi:hypothetical protein
MQKHLDILVVVYLLIGTIGTVFGMLILYAVKNQMPDLLSFIDNYIEANEIKSLQGLLLTFYALPGLAASLGIYKRKQWGRIISLFWSVLNIPTFLIGTVVGIYSLWVLLKSETKELFIAADKKSFI